MTKSYNRSICLMLFFLLLRGLNGYGQALSPERTMVRVDATNLSIKALLQDIEKQTDYVFNYDENQVNLNQKISLKLSSSLNRMLSAISGNTDLGFQVSGNTISVRKVLLREQQASRMITGIITEARTGLPIPGVNIYKKGTAQGAVTNIAGEFTFKLNGVDLENIVLEFKYIGMKTRTERVGNKSFFRIALEDDVMGMDEVVVTSSYTKEKRREEVVGSIAQLNPRQLQVQRPIESFDKMLEGLVAGVHVETNTELNTPVRINIRGLGSLPQFGTSRTTSSQPLFVIDGIPSYEQQRANENGVFSGENYLNPLSNINPEDIATVSILKDATASALYGANAANGVIIITTKNGRAGETNVNFNYDTGVSTFINEFKWLSGPQYYSLLREAYVNSGRSVADASLSAGSSTINTNWLDLTTRNAVYQNAGMDISGGSETTNFRFSAGYRDQKAASLGNDLQKAYVRLKLNHAFSDKFKVGFNLSPTLTRSNALSAYGAVSLPPNISPYNADGSYADILGVPNPIAILNQNENSNKGLELMANVNASYQVNREIAISGTLGADYYQNKQTQYLSSQNATGRSSGGNLTIYDRNHLGYIAFLQATYDKTIDNAHTVNFLVGTQLEDKTTDLLRGSGTRFSFERLRVLTAAGTRSSASSTNSNASVSYYSQLGYDLHKKYYANFNGRIDKSSMFGGDKQVALNGSAGVAWIISKEEFLKDSKAINLLKLRATYGTTGNSRIGSYAAKGLYTINSGASSTYNGNVTANPDGTAAPNPDLGWERNNKLNLALDMTLFDKLNITAEYYQNTIHDLISSVVVPWETGFTTISANTGKMRNKGFELSLNTQLLDGANFGWNMAYNLGWNRNRMIAFNNGYSAIYSETALDGIKIGESSSALYGYRWAGVDKETGAEMFHYNDQLLTSSQINSIATSESVVLGDRLPDFQGGLINNFKIYDFNLSFNVLYSYGADQYLGVENELDGHNLAHRNQSVNLLDRWQRAGDETGISRLLVTRSFERRSSRYVSDVSYLKLSNVSLSYRFPQQLSKKLRLSNLSLFTNATNLFYLYKEKGVKGRNGIAEKRFTFPEMMSITGGIRVGF